MKSKINTFEQFVRLLESEGGPNQIEVEFPQKWEEMKDLGFYDASSPRIRANGNILLKNDSLNYYPEGLILQISSGYLRDKAARSGFIKRGSTLEQMVDYIIQRFKKYQSEVSTAGDEETLIFFKKNSEGRGSATKNSQTGRWDLTGSLKIRRKDLEFLKKKGIKLGDMKARFTYEGDPTRGQSESLSSEDLDFFPTSARDFELLYLSLSFSDFTPIPTRIGEELILRKIKGLQSLSGIKIGPNSDIMIYECPDLRNLGSDLPRKMNRLDLDLSENKSLRSLDRVPDVIIHRFELIPPDQQFRDRIEIPGGEWKIPGIPKAMSETKDPKIKKLLLSALTKDFIQKMIDKDPAKAMEVLRGYLAEDWVKRMNLVWPEETREYVQTLTDLEDIGF